ncbi:MAG: sigma 54-interacting transcriptional regulator [Bacteroidota bacterium]
MNKSTDPVSYLESTFSHYPSAVLAVDTLARVQYASPGSKILFKEFYHQLIGSNWAGLDVKLTLMGWKQYWKQAKEQGSFIYETDLLSEDSDMLWPIEVSLVDFTDDMLLVFIEDRLEKDSNRLSLEILSQESQIAHWRYSLYTNGWSWSENISHLLSIPADGSHTNPLDHFGQNDKDALEAEIEKSFSEGRSFELQLHGTSKSNNQSYTISGHPVTNDLQTAYLIGTFKKNTYTTDDRLSTFTKHSLDHTTDCICWVRADGTLTYANRVFYRLLDYTNKDLPSLSVYDIVQDLNKETFEAQWNELVSNRNAEGDFFVRHRSGTSLPANYRAFYLELGDEAYACYYINDAAHERQLNHEKALMQLSIAGARDLIFWTRPDGTFAYINNSVAKKLRYKSKDFQKMNVVDIAPYFDDEFRADFWRQLRENKQIEGLFDVVRSDGKTVVLSANVSYLNHDGVEAACSICRDITQKQRRDANLHLSRVALDSGADSIVWLDEDHKILYINQSLLDHIGGELSTWNGQAFSKIFPDLSEEDIDLENPREIDMPSRNGQTIRLDLKFGHIEFEDQVYYTIVGRDITETYHKRQELQKAYARIEELRQRLQAENVAMRQDTRAQYDVGNIITVSKKYKRVIQQIGQVAETDTTVLILGETGTGKELLARAVHSLSRRDEGPLIKVNCAALPANLIESELFGHEKGAFTGAHARKIGRFEAADGGSIFLDEVGELPLDLQAKLLRVLQEGDFERIGSMKTIKVDVRVIAATNRNLEKMVEQGSFRADLYYRLNVFPVNNPPLRERPEDIEVLVKHFAIRYAKQQGKNIDEIDKADLENLKAYSFPGNVRELKNIIQRAVVLCNSRVLKIAFEHSDKEKSTSSSGSFKTFDEMQRQYIIKALKRTSGRITGPQGAGRLLGLNDRTLMSKMRKFEIEKKEFLV